MYIKEVELKNFKSFGRSVRVPLKNDCLTVTGPNGSGKSNIVDALLFALCLSSSRAMRAERLPDLIYRGEGSKNPDFAETILIALLPDDGSPMSFDRSSINETFKKPFDAKLLAERLRTLIGAKKELV